MPDTVKAMLACETIAVVGATNRTEKFGYKIFQDLRAKGYTVYPVHPAIREIEGVEVYKTIADIPETPEVVCLVVPPAVTEKVVKTAAEIGVKYVWMQPGASSEEAIRTCEENNIPCVHDQCIMVLSKN